MTDVSGIVAFLGEPPTWDQAVSFDEVERRWQVTLPQDYKDLATVYGDVAVAGYLNIFGPRALGDLATASLGQELGRTREIPNPILPTPGGMLHWGSTAYADQLFLVPRPGRAWTVSAWVRIHAEWVDYDLTCVEWLRAALAEEVATEWLPEWEGTYTLE